MKTGKIKTGLILIFIVALQLNISYAQNVIQSTIKKGSAVNRVDLFIKPNFSNSDPAVYLFQLQFPITWPNLALPTPTGLLITLDPAFTAFFGNYTVTVYPLATHAGTSENCYTISLIRVGSAPTFWTSGTEYKVLTAEFTNIGTAPMTLVRVSDFLDRGSDKQGNYYALSGLGTYYRDNVSPISNFYFTPQSTIGGTANDGYAQTLDFIVLSSADLLSFSGYKDGSRNQLRWTTSTEKNNKGFEVQRSPDGINFSDIGFVNSLANGGNSSVTLNYAFTDNNVTGIKQYYRLRLVDLAGNSKLSNVVLIKSDKPTLITIDGLFPNPATTTINLRVGAPNRDRLTIVVTDISGRMVMQQNMNVETGNNTLPLDISALPDGNYFIKLISSNGEVSTGRFVKQ